eukprot:1502026-Pyramimonas_sp.AAC.1
MAGMGKTPPQTRLAGGSERGTPRSLREEQRACPHHKEVVGRSAHPWQPSTGRGGRYTKRPTPS